MPHGIALASWALVLGLVQGFTHCAAMCGPLVAAFQAQLAARDPALRPPASLGPAPHGWGWGRTPRPWRSPRVVLAAALAGADIPQLASPVDGSVRDHPLSPARFLASSAEAGLPYWPGRWTQLTLLHQAGRVVAFTALGALAGAAGRLAALAAAARGLDSAAAVVGGLGMLLWAVEHARTGQGGRVLERLSPVRAAGLAGGYRALVRRADGVGAFLAGSVLGLHPCGLIFAVLLAAAATASPEQGAFTLAAFGLGTVPALCSVAGLSRLALGRRRAPVWRYVTAAWVAASGVLFLLRALALDRVVPHIQTWLF